MPVSQNSYEFITQKINSMKTSNPSLRNKPNEYVFSALCVKANFFKNPALVLNDSDYEDFIVDSRYDGGVDVLLNDPNSENSDLIIGQSKFYQNITFDDVQNAILKMVLFYKEMQNGHYEQVNENVQRRFISLNSELGEESKIHFVFYTSAPLSGIRRDRLQRKFKDQFSGVSNVELSLLFGSDIEEEIKESESRRPTVENGKITIDEADNCLWYGDDAAIVNVSAFSIKQLYAQHNTNLLARNLRYHITGRDIDNAIRDTIKDDPDSFWLKNNGITIICDDFRISGKEVHLHNFSIVNGGQTTYMIHRSPSIDNNNDLFLPCKIIQIIGETEDEKNLFSLSIAKATNSQKAIKPVDLKANSPEQVRFSQAMREVGIFYQTKRGEVVPAAFRTPYLNTDLLEIGKLCLAAIFQVPCTSRSKPSSLYQEKYYQPIFNRNQSQIAKICTELLYIDYYFRKVYQREFDRANVGQPDEITRVPFAHNARTICIAFVAFAARYRQGNITEQDISPIFRRGYTLESVSDPLYEAFSNLGNIKYLIKPEIFADKNQYDIVLKKLFNIIIEAGITNFIMESRHDSTLTATNFLKREKNYYDILSLQWFRTKEDINKVFEEIGM